MAINRPSSIKHFSDVFFIYVQQGDMNFIDRMEAHNLKYVISGQMLIDDGKREVSVGSGECVFIRRDHRIKIRKLPTTEADFRCITLVFKRDFLRRYFQEIETSRPRVKLEHIPEAVVPLTGLPQLEGLFLSLRPYMEKGINPSDALMELKLREGVLALLEADERFYPTLFDFAEAWKIDILDFMEANYMCDLTINDMANYTGRSLATFKRDFAKVSPLSPERWILHRRLEAAYDLLRHNKAGVADAAYAVGFKNRSHFTKAFKEKFGVSPSSVVPQ